MAVRKAPWLIVNVLWKRVRGVVAVVDVDDSVAVVDPRGWLTSGSVAWLKLSGFRLALAFLDHRSLLVVQVVVVVVRGVRHQPPQDRGCPPQFVGWGLQTSPDLKTLYPAVILPAFSKQF